MATRLLEGVHREIWQENTPLGGGSTQTITTGIRTSAAVLSNVFGILKLASAGVALNVVATPSVSADGYLVVTIANNSAPGVSITWLLDVFLEMSTQQAPTFNAMGVIHVVGPGLGSGIPAVDSVADLRLYPTRPVCIEVLGYYARGDGGGGLFYWAAASTTTDDGGMFIQPTGGGPVGRWIRMPSEDGAVNVLWWGALGIGPTNNDTPAVQAAIDYVRANGGIHNEVGGGKVLFPIGQFAVTGLELPDSSQAVTLEGLVFSFSEEHRLGSRIMPYGKPPYLLRIAATSIGIILQNLIFDCNQISPKGVTFAPVEGFMDDFITFDNCQFWNPAPGGTFVDDTDAKVHGGENAIVTFRDCNLQLNSPTGPLAQATAIYIKNAACYFWTVERTYISGGAGPSGAIFLQGGDLTLRDVSFDNNPYYDVLMENSAKLTVDNVRSGSRGTCIQINQATVPGLLGANQRNVISRLVTTRYAPTSGYSIIDNSTSPLTIRDSILYAVDIEPPSNQDKKLNLSGVTDWSSNDCRIRILGNDVLCNELVSQGDTDTTGIVQCFSHELTSFVNLAHTNNDPDFSETFNLNSYKPGQGYLPFIIAATKLILIGQYTTAMLMKTTSPGHAPPAAPPALFGQTFYRINGGGKMEYCVLFPTGAVPVIATEP